MADRDPTDLLRENAYLKQRNAQLQSDILDLSAEAERLRRLNDRLHGRTAVTNPDAPAGGQPYPPRTHASPRGAPATVSEDQALAGSLDDGDPTNERVMSEYGIRRTTVDYFHVGGYRYTSMNEAVAEAERQRKIP